MINNVIVNVSVVVKQLGSRRRSVSAPKNFLSAPNGSRRFFTFLHQNYFFSAPNSFFFHTKTIFFAPNHFCKLIRFCTKFILILHQIFCKLGQNYIDFAPNISWNFSGLAPNLFRSSTKLSPISTNFFLAMMKRIINNDVFAPNNCITFFFHTNYSKNIFTFLHQIESRKHIM